MNEENEGQICSRTILEEQLKVKGGMLWRLWPQDLGKGGVPHVFTEGSKPTALATLTFLNPIINVAIPLIPSRNCLRKDESLFTNAWI